MASHIDGGSAFPRAAFYPDTSMVHGSDLREAMDTMSAPVDGMSLRDWLAGRIVSGLVAQTDVATICLFNDAEGMRRVVGACVRMADELLRHLHPELFPVRTGDLVD